MTPQYDPVERQCSPVREDGSPVWFKLTYRRDWVAERGLWRDMLVNQEIVVNLKSETVAHVPLVDNSFDHAILPENTATQSLRANDTIFPRTSASRLRTSSRMRIPPR